jgi:RNA polymerase sigma-70 factor (ECF subfamily)
MRRFCFSQALPVVRCPVAADEAAQEAIVRAWRHRASCRQPDHPFGWLSRIARNEALRVVSRRPREVLVSEPLESRTALSSEDQVETGLLIETALRSLSPADQELARLRYYEDFTCAKLAEHWGINEATVKVRLHRLRRRLRETLEEEI